jgi:PAS domain S-box-containing protein
VTMSQRIRVLSVEDSQDDAKLLELELKRAGYETELMRVETTAEYRSALRNDSWDIVISDHTLPEFDSMSALNILKELELDIPFIIMSGTISEDVAVEAMRSGARDYVLKTNMKRLVPAVRRELKEAKARRERGHVEEALARSEESFRNIVEAATEGIWVIDEESKTVFANRRIADMLGYTREEMAGRSLFEFMTPEQKALAEKNVARRQMGIQEQHDFRFLRRDGTQLWAIVSTYPRFHADGCYAGALAMITDISDRKKAEELIRKNSEDLKDLIEIAAHELRHPATVFKGYAQILMENWEDLDRETIQEALSGIDEATTRLMRLVTSLLEASCLERGNIDLSLSEIDPVGPVRSAIEEFGLRELDRELRLTCAGLDKEEMDADKVKQVLEILIDNAAKYSDTESPIDIGCVKVDGEIVYSVADLGPGIPDEDREGIFTRFYHAGDVLHHSVPGIGLGLYIAKVIVEVHGGWISEEPRDGGGSVFSFGIPSIRESDDVQIGIQVEVAR